MFGVESVTSAHTPRVFFNIEVNDSDLCETFDLLLPCGLLTEMNDMIHVPLINPTHAHAKPEENKLETNCVKRGESDARQSAAGQFQRVFFRKDCCLCF